MERITGKPIVTYMRLKRVRPTRSRCIRKLRAIRRTLLVEPLYLLESETPEMLFWSLLREGAFPCEDDIFDHINKLIGIGYPVQVLPLQQCKESEFGFAYCWENRAKQECRIELKLSSADD